ncbi:sulfite exporter TauE/SafE family protein [Lentibacillus sp. N15]|uniref:sulfite exporter TauE/SafE family protein n=1 Tax=Lentibacillus songyuanensis TaxID=3136161 RepID=UPI0031BB58CF
MDYSIMFIIAIFLIGFIGSFISGMVGIGGAIINYPMLLYIPAALGFAGFSAYEASGITAVQVFFATAAGALAYRKGGYLNKTIIVYMGISVLIGSFLGGFVSSYMLESGINIVYGILALLAVVMMFLPKKENEGTFDSSKFNRWLAAAISLIVGVGAGIVGAGGAFLLVPVMLTILKIPTRVTIASSLAITFISSIGAASSKMLTGQVLIVPAIVMIMASLLASPLGAKAGKRINTKYLQWILAVLIVGTAIKVWWDII